MRINSPPIFAERIFCECRDVCLGFSHGGAQGVIRFERSGEKFFRRNGELRGGKFCAVEAFGQFQHGSITACGHSFEDSAGLLLDGGIKEAGGCGDLGELRGEIFISMTNHSHVGRLGETGVGRKNEEKEHSSG